MKLGGCVDKMDSDGGRAKGNFDETCVRIQRRSWDCIQVYGKEVVRERISNGDEICVRSGQ